MLAYARLKKNPRAFRTFTGLDQSEFEALLPSFERAWNNYIYNTHIKKKKRKRRYGAGRKARLRNIEDKLLCILVYFRLYPIQEVMAYLFDMSQGRVNEWMHRLTDILQHA
jgi:hypothetical protein